MKTFRIVYIGQMDTLYTVDIGGCDDEADALKCFNFLFLNKDVIKVLQYDN